MQNNPMAGAIAACKIELANWTKRQIAAINQTAKDDADFRKRILETFTPDKKY